MNKTIWAIEQGNYSDYHIVGVFSSKEHAEFALERLSTDYGHASIAEWPLDPAITEFRQGYTQWAGRMAYDGTVECMIQQNEPLLDLQTRLAIWRRSTAPAFKGQNIQDCLHGYVFAKDQAHAIKIFNETRVQLIANGEWTAPAEA